MNNGYYIFPEPPPEALALVEAYKDVDVTNWRKRGKTFLKKSPDVSAKSVPRDINEVFKLVHPMVTEYLGKYSLCSLALWHTSINPSLEYSSSQLYHRDWEDDHGVKLFVYLKDVGPNNGPFTFIDAEGSAKITEKLGYVNDKSHRVDDETIYDIHDKPIVVTGKAGTTFMVDTCACFHYGGRVISGERLMANLQFLKPTNRQKEVIRAARKDSKRRGKEERKKLGKKMSREKAERRKARKAAEKIAAAAEQEVVLKVANKTASERLHKTAIDVYNEKYKTTADDRVKEIIRKAIQEATKK